MAMEPTGNELHQDPPDDGRFPGWMTSSRLWARVGIAAGILFALYLVLGFLRDVYTDALWFSNLGFGGVYRTVITTKLWLFASGLVISGAAFGAVYRGVIRSSWGPTTLPVTERTATWIRRALLAGATTMGLIIALSFATGLSTRYDQFLRFMNSVAFDRQDPVFGNDVGFYVFTLPMLHTIQGWLMGLAIVALITGAGLHMLVYSIRGINPEITPQARTLLALIGAGLMFSIALAHFLDVYETLFSSSGAVTGATYADLTARIPALRLLTVVAAIAGLIMLYTLRVQNVSQAMRLQVAAFALWIVAALLAGLAWPALVQRFAVAPAELDREREFIARNIEWTRLGYDLERVVEQPYNVQTDTLARDIAANPETIGNIRLWDPRPLEDVYNQVQHLRLYYSFLDVDVDRYTIDGEYRQVLVGTRELFQHGLDSSAQNWVNRRLVYTHGYGVVMSTATDQTESGQPNLVVRDVPTTGAFPVDQPRIYYGESFGLDASDYTRILRLPEDAVPRGGAVTDDTVVVNTLEQQFDRPSNTPDGLPVFADTYDGDGGVHLSSMFRRLAYAWELADVNLLISSQLTEDSRVLYRRSIRERIDTVAPFLLLDDDPYLVVDDGHLYWIQDTYLTTDHLPYSSRQSLSLEDLSNTLPFNYIRNSVKVVMDAYDGTLDFYAIEPSGSDPLLATYDAAFPGLFQPFDAMPRGLREHIRYPEELLRAQAGAFVQYHMTDPKEFFLKEDQWELAEEVFGAEAAPRTVTPYYVIMKLPGETSEEFVLVLPFTPQDKPNLVAWMAARSDGEHYGEIEVFEFPKDRLFNGPSQIEARIDNDPVISEQFTLWNQSGSQVIRGNLLVIPIGEALLYAEPIYLQAESLAFPELKRVILATADRVVMEPTLADAVDALLGGIQPTMPDGEPVPGGIPRDQLIRVLEDLRNAVESLRGGADGLDQALRDLEALAGDTTP